MVFGCGDAEEFTVYSGVFSACVLQGSGVFSACVLQGRVGSALTNLRVLTFDLNNPVARSPWMIKIK